MAQHRILTPGYAVVPRRREEPHPEGRQPGSIFGTTDVYTVKTPLPGDSARFSYSAR